MFGEVRRTENIKVNDRIEVFGHADHVANRVYEGVVVRVTPTGRVVIRLDYNNHEYPFAKCGRGLGVNPCTIRNKYLTKPV